MLSTCSMTATGVGIGALDLPLTTSHCDASRHHNVTKIPIIHVFVNVFVSLHVDI